MFFEMVGITNTAIFWLSVLAILYTYFGYPILVTLLAAFRPNPKPFEPYLPSITLLIAAYNEEIVIEDKIKNSLAVDYPRDRYQILIVTDGSSDQTADIVGKYRQAGVDLIHQPERQGKMAAINRALPTARGEIIVFSDANNFYLADTLKRLVAPFADPAVGGVSGAKVIDQGDGNLGASEGIYWRYESFIKKQESRLGSCTSGAGEILAIRKEGYIAPPGNIINDDFFIAMQIVRQGYRLVYVPEAKSRERVSPTAKDEIVRRTRINAGRFQAIRHAGQILPFKQPILVWQVISHKFMRPLVPFFMIGAALSNILAFLIPDEKHRILGLGLLFGVLLLALQGLFYLTALTGSLLAGEGNQSKFTRLLYIPTFLTNSNIAALKGFMQFMRGGHYHIWERIERR